MRFKSTREKVNFRFYFCASPKMCENTKLCVAYFLFLYREGVCRKGIGTNNSVEWFGRWTMKFKDFFLSVIFTGQPKQHQILMAYKLNDIPLTINRIRMTFWAKFESWFYAFNLNQKPMWLFNRNKEITNTKYTILKRLLNDRKKKKIFEKLRFALVCDKKINFPFGINWNFSFDYYVTFMCGATEKKIFV